MGRLSLAGRSPLARLALQQNRDPAALELARKLHQQGYNWDAQFAPFGYTDKVTKDLATLKTHGVNNAMALKVAAVWGLVGGTEGRSATNRMRAELDNYHGQPNGMHAADEHYAGLNPSQGVELCAVVEAMFSYEVLLGILGDAEIGDRLERVAFNALPGAFSPDMWAHQYDQQPNQVLVSLGKRAWATNGPESNIFGLEPNFGCCTANMHQGWPKFTANLWMRTADGGLVAAAYSPSTVTTQVGNGAKVKIEEVTDYPFRDRVTLNITLDREAEFPLLLRIPNWTQSPRISVNETPLTKIETGSFTTVRRLWHSGDRVEISFLMSMRLERGYHNAISLTRGPLVYSLAIGEQWSKLKQTGPATDWEVFPTTPWNYALQMINGKALSEQFQIHEERIGKQPFSFEGAPIFLEAKARRLPEWVMDGDSAGALPVSPVESKRPLETVRLIPYGCAKLRITEFPYLQ